MQIGTLWKALDKMNRFASRVLLRNEILPTKNVKNLPNVRKVAKSPFNFTAARFVFTGSPIIFSQHIKLQMGQESDGVLLYNLP